MPFTHGAGPYEGKVEVEGVILVDRPLAIELQAEGKREWLPKRRLNIEHLRGGRVAVRMPHWLARAKKFV